jgi:hypothetical protein
VNLFRPQNSAFVRWDGITASPVHDAAPRRHRRELCNALILGKCLVAEKAVTSGAARSDLDRSTGDEPCRAPRGARSGRCCVRRCTRGLATIAGTQISTIFCCFLSQPSGMPTLKTLANARLFDAGMSVVYECKLIAGRTNLYCTCAHNLQSPPLFACYAMNLPQMPRLLSRNQIFSAARHAPRSRKSRRSQ